MKEVLGDEVGLALDCGPGWMLPDAIRFAKAVEPLNIIWLEDMLTGDYVPCVNADVYRELTQSTTTPIHTGEQIYLRQNFKELIEKQAVRIVGPDPADVGGIAELKWVAEYADLHGILMAPHGTFDGLIGLGRARPGRRRAAAQLHRLRVPRRPAGVVVRHRRGPARSDRQGRLHQGLGPARPRRRLQRQGGQGPLSDEDKGSSTRRRAGRDRGARWARAVQRAPADSRPIREPVTAAPQRTAGGQHAVG